MDVARRVPESASAVTVDPLDTVPGAGIKFG